MTAAAVFHDATGARAPGASVRMGPTAHPVTVTSFGSPRRAVRGNPNTKVN